MKILLSIKISYMFERIIETLLFLVSSYGIACADTSRYECDGFGYIEIDEDLAKCTIFKNSGNGSPRNIASCDVTEMSDSFLRISNENELGSMFDGTEVTTLDRAQGKTVRVVITIPNPYGRPYDVCIYNYLQSKEYRKKWNPDGIEFNIGPEGKGCVTVCVIPEINPFDRIDSWGDSQTASRILSDGLEIDVRFNDLEIKIPNTINDYFFKWNVDNEYVVRLEDCLLWRNHKFHQIK